MPLLLHHAVRLIAWLLQGSEENVEHAMAAIFVWLRYSSARHLTWQRNYNTQPRILGEAQAKLTHKIAEVPLLLHLVLKSVLLGHASVCSLYHIQCCSLQSCIPKDAWRNAQCASLQPSVCG